MVIFGEEYGFKLTVGASAAIAELCPDGDLSRISEVVNDRTSKAIRFTAHFIAELAKGFDDARRYAGEEVTHKPLTADMLMALSSDVFKEVEAAAVSAFRGDTEVSVEVAPSKKKESQEKELT